MSNEIQLYSGIENVSNFDSSEHNEANKRETFSLQWIENNDQNHLEIIPPEINILNENYDINVSLRLFDIMKISQLQNSN